MIQEEGAALERARQNAADARKTLETCERKLEEHEQAHGCADTLRDVA